MKSVVAIIGRPNVGKSTLFNRLAKRNKAIVINEPGATRDRNYADAVWEGKHFSLIDTGGFEPASEERILIQMREQTTLAMEEADIIIFLMDGRSGLIPADRDIAAILREVKKPVFFVVNKVDGPKQEDLALEFYEIGMDHLYTVSAQHGLGIYELMDDVAALIPESPPEEDDEDAPIRIALIGKPNVGKSSLINRILGMERTIVNPLPGTTRDAIDTPFERDGKKYVLIDTAGIRRKSRISLTLEKFSVVQALKTISRCDIALILIDAAEGMTDQDVKIAGLAYEEGKACIIVVNKWDVVEKDNSTVGKYVNDIKDKSKFLDFAPIIFVSALMGQRVMKIFDIIQDVYSEYTKRVGTGEFNRICREIIEKNALPRSSNRLNTFAYMTQVSIKPPTFIFFVRDPKGVHFSYERFLVNQIREAFGFQHVPIRLFFKRKSRTD
ncbi:MAG: ribosome biogenesis GTPase Der [Syntrophales bacterium]|nr:ribosome biogenesis GTPase Der [Syntrophales bacterium]